MPDHCHPVRRLQALASMADNHARRLESTIQAIEQSIEVERRIADSQPQMRDHAEGRSRPPRRILSACASWSRTPW
jgi:hypothetical protein